MDRHVDGCYFRVKRNGRYKNICFSDLEREERIEVLNDKSKEFLISMCELLADTLKEIGNEFDIIRK